MALQTEKLLDMDATAVKEAIQNGEISATDAVNTYIEHIEKVNGMLNAFVQNRFEEARKEAALVDEKIKSGEISGKLLGVPITIKDSFDIKGMATTGGIPHLKDATASEDAEVVKRLKKEGAIFLGKTNTPVLCFCQETDNKLYGRTNNPWNLSRTAGGSSGGEGSLLAAGGAAVGIGSDIGGSIRFPSHFNGIVGFKSGNKQVSQVGSFPYVNIPQQERMLGIGAMGKSVRDAELINDIIANEVPKEVNIREFKAIIPINSLFYPVDDAVKQALLNVKTTIVNHSMETFDEEPPYFRDSALLWQLIMSIDGGEGVAKIAFGEKRARPLAEFLKERLVKKSDLHHYFTWAIFGANFFRPSQKKIKEINSTLEKGDQEIGEYLNKAILILPVYHTTALPHGQVYWELFSIFKTFKKYIPFVAYANTWGLPSLTVPVLEDKNGLPIGIQIISAIGNERALFEVGKWLEESLRGYRRAVLY